MIVKSLYRSDYTYEELLSIGTRYCVPIRSVVTDDTFPGQMQRFAAHIQERPGGKKKIFYINMIDIINKSLGIE